MSESANSSLRLLTSTMTAAAVAAAVLILFVLPAEYGIDPTGIGARIGLQQMIAIGDDEETGPVVAPTDDSLNPPTTISALEALWKSPSVFRNDEMSLTLQPNAGAEIKAKMQAGERFVFSWDTQGGALVSFDMHGDADGAAEDDFTSYFKGRGAASGNGAFIAPFAGNHGWYWRNRTAEPVTVRVKTSGFYEKLFRP